MSEKYETGNYGRARFPQEKKGFNSGIDAYGVIKSIEKRYILFQDNDDYLYLIDRNDFQFEVCEFKDKTK